MPKHVNEDSVAIRGLSEEDVADLKEAFDNFDRNGDGTIDSVELATVLRSLGYSPTKDQLKKLMDKVDLDGTGDISFEEFVVLMRVGGMETDYEKEINGAFFFFDKNGDGQVDRQELAEIMRGLGDKLTDEEIDLLINAADKDKDGTISMKEFVTFMFDEKAVHK
ncbi:unnamed protein product [Ectocarpus sp. CCAP 1310/34]|nr:unnamed protein product [Ectocarpus sp. CCAP 1310/34]